MNLAKKTVAQFNKHNDRNNLFMNWKEEPNWTVKKTAAQKWSHGYGHVTVTISMMEQILTLPKNDSYKAKSDEILIEARNGNWMLKLIVCQFAEAAFVHHIAVLTGFVAQAISRWMGTVQNLHLNHFEISLHILMVVTTAWTPVRKRAWSCIFSE